MTENQVVEAPQGTSAPQPVADAALSHFQEVMQPETPAKPEPAAEEASTDPEESSSDSADSKKQDEGRYKRRISQLMAEKYRHKAEADHAKALAAELQAKLEQRQAAQTPQPTDDKAPKQSEFATYDEFISAYSRHVARTETAALIKAEREQAERQRAMAEQERQNTDFAKKQDKAREVHADYDEAVSWLAGQLPQPTIPYLSASDHGADLVYHLGKNPELVEKLQSLPPVLQVRELVLLEEQIKPQPKKTAVSKPPTPTNGGAGADTSWYRPDMTDKQWSAARAKRLGRK